MSLKVHVLWQRNGKRLIILNAEREKKKPKNIRNSWTNAKLKLNQWKGGGGQITLGN